MSGLDELFARLKAQAPTGNGQHPPQQQALWANAQQASVSSPMFSPPVHTPNPIHSSDIISPANPSSNIGSPAPDQNRTNHLLNLLRFNNHQAGQNVQVNVEVSLHDLQILQDLAQGGKRKHQVSPVATLHNSDVGGEDLSGTALGGQLQTSTSVSASEQTLTASPQRKPSVSGALPSPLAGLGAERNSTPQTSSGNQQDFLLNLLRKPNAPKPVESIENESAASHDTAKNDSSVDRLAQSLAEADISREPTPARHFGSRASRGNTPFEAPQPTKAAMFSYVNPFDELSASSPLNRTPGPESQSELKKMEILKHNRDASGTNGENGGPAAKTRKLETSAPETNGKGQSVSEALEGVGEKVDKQAEQALSQAETRERQVPATTGDNAADKAANPRKGTADNYDVESSWESAEDSANEKTLAQPVKVYNFPMKPFVTIHIKSTGAAIPIRQDNFMVVAQLKKEFDQMDRCLVTASQAHIVYAQTATKKDNSGFRLIRQETGDHKQVFRSSGERIFSLQICSSPDPGNDVESVLGTGVNGSVFWTNLSRSEPELFGDDDVQAQGFIMPAVASAEENASNSPVKTRAKCSTRHPQFFALSRSKMIHIISPDAVKDKSYTHPTTRKVDSAKYLAESGIRINTGKAGKDFAFSEDDSVIVSLDKSGVVKFWNIRDITQRLRDESEWSHEPVELKEPIWSLAAAASGSKADEKPSVSSVMLLDKERPHHKGVALRYMLVGFKQNHILQLWDLGLGKAVQELRLPHEKDSDGFCSITYHPKTGIVALGHPTRNSIYFVHLSAPKYNLPPLDQARYVNLLASHDKSLPKPESTAIMSGLRECSLNNVGQLRSLDMLKTPVDNASVKGSVDETLFELYVLHSKGVFGMPVKRADLGWDAQSKMVAPVDAVTAGVVDVLDLVLPPAKDVNAATASSSSVETAIKKNEKVQIKKAEAARPAPQKTVDTATRRTTASPAPPAPNNPQRDVKAEKPSMQVPEAPTPSQTSAVNPPIVTADSYAMAAQRTKSPARDKAVENAASASIFGPFDPSGTTTNTVAAADGNMENLLSKQFDSLYQRLDADKRVSDAAGAAKQDAVLRLVSSTLTENVEQSLSRIITSSIDKEVIPALTSTTSSMIEKKLAEVLPQQLGSVTQREIKAALPSALQTILKDGSLHQGISDQVAQKVQQQVVNTMSTSLPRMATQAAQKMVADLESRTSQRLREADLQRQQDNAKIEQLSSMVHNLSQTMQSMADGQKAFQEEMRKMQQAHVKETAAPASASEPAPAAPVEEVDPEKAAEEAEVSRITQMLVDGNYEGATWLQSANQASLFDRLFIRVNPAYLRQVSGLVALSVSAAITASFSTEIDARLEWLSEVLGQMNTADPDICDVAPKIMDVLSQRLQGAYMELSEVNPRDARLRRISALNRQVNEVRRVTA
ncbi:hypothetical protein B0A50_05426 [Salinomyces thailandicus]|uniref:EDC4-like protein pdc1 beta-propeller domain-containing protein n=1 Tax=Salinomyces thailandicus TaxID=706561 RepID=A0A4U0TUS9_9PEZI|nr:hypothetical protein B0A50_05426 [Salinomyces thailandica]